MIKRYVTAAVSVILVFMIQSTVFKVLALAGITPNLLVILTSAIGFMRGKKEGMFAGILSGALIDIFYCDVFGINALIYMYVGYVNGIFRKNFLPEDVRLPMLLIGASDLIYCGAIVGLRFVLRSKFDIFYYFMHIIMPELVYTILVSIIMYRLIYLVSRQLDKLERRSPKKFV